MERQHIPNESHLEYVFNLLINATEEQKMALDPSDAKQLINKKTTLAFCKRAPQERLDAVLAKLGYSWVKIYALSEDMIAQAAFNTFNQYSFAAKRADATNAMARNQIYATSDREFFFTLNMMSQNCVNRVYGLSNITQKLVNRGNTGMEERLRDGVKAWQRANNYILGLISSFEYAKGHLQLEKEDVLILSALFTRINSAMTIQELSEVAQIKGKAKVIKKFLDDLVKRNLIMTDANGKGRSVNSRSYYTLTTSGIDRIMSYLKFVNTLIEKT